MTKATTAIALLLYPMTLLIYFDPPDLTLTVEPEFVVPADAEALIAAQACYTLGVQKVPLPVPFTIVWMTAAKEGAALYRDPKDPRTVKGWLTRCP